MPRPDGDGAFAARSYRVAKRLLDVVAASAGIVTLAPILGAVSGAILATMGRPIFFRQVRPGLDGQPIRVWKFRTMSNARDVVGRLLPDDQRLTGVGRFLRRTSLDELPQLFNVLHGDMSLVGPRPLLMRYLTRYSERQKLRHSVKPGITGWAQINGRNALDWETRLELDVWYAEHASFWLDVRILLRTVLATLDHSGVLAGGTSEFAEFWGSEAPPGDVVGFPSEEDDAQAVAGA